MDKFKEMFTNLVQEINEKAKEKGDFEKFISENSDKEYFIQAIKDLMESNDIWTRVYAASVSIDYSIEPKKAKKVATKILKKESFDLYSVEAEFVLEKYKKKNKGFLTFFK